MVMLQVITNTVSVDYLSKPVEVFKEMHRVLKPGGKAIMSFSNRCFPTKGDHLLRRAHCVPVIWRGTPKALAHCPCVETSVAVSVSRPTESLCVNGKPAAGIVRAAPWLLRTTAVMEPVCIPELCCPHRRLCATAQRSPCGRPAATRTTCSLLAPTSTTACPAGGRRLRQRTSPRPRASSAAVTPCM